MDRVFLIFLFSVATFCAVTVSAHRDDHWFPGWGAPPHDATPPPLYPAPTVPQTPSPYYDPPPYYAPPPSEPPYYQKTVSVEELFQSLDDITKAPSYSAPLGSPAYSVAPSYQEMPWMTDRLVENPDQWPAPYSSTTTVEEVFGPDAEKVYGSISLLDGLSAKGEDGYSQLLKQGIAALLNAIDKHFKIKDDDIKKCFSFQKSLASENTAAVQAHVFAEANDEYAASHA